MIKIGNYTVNTKHFPDGTQCLMDVDTKLCANNSGYFNIRWNYESDEELVTLIYLVNHLRSLYHNCCIRLSMPYIPNARMDRTKHNSEVFTLKYFADIINSLNFDMVSVLDPHSDVSVALLNRVYVESPDDYIARAIQIICNNNHIINDDKIVIYFPDAGAYKRYKDMECLKPYHKYYGQKTRDWESGKITGLKIVNENNTEFSLDGKVVIMVDDIISYGGTFYYSSLELKKLGAEKIYAYASHVEPKSLWDKEKGTFIKSLLDGTVTKLYTTNSIYNLDANDFVIPISLF